MKAPALNLDISQLDVLLLNEKVGTLTETPDGLPRVYQVFFSFVQSLFCLRCSTI